jgi:hypothetical protein
MEGGEVEADAAQRTAFGTHPAEIVAVKRRSDGARERSTEAEAVDGPSLVLVEPALPSLQALLGGSCARKSEQHRK